jgi:hypothetical protein
MIWQGLTDAQICESVKDQSKGGWNPGEGRTPVSVPHDEFTAKVKQWERLARLTKLTPGTR